MDNPTTDTITVSWLTITGDLIEVQVPTALAAVLEGDLPMLEFTLGLRLRRFTDPDEIIDRIADNIAALQATRDQLVAERGG